MKEIRFSILLEFCIFPNDNHYCFEYYVNVLKATNRFLQTERHNFRIE